MEARWVIMKQISSTRDAILYKLRSQGRMPISALAQQLQLTEMAIRRHLHELAKQDYVQIISVKQSMGRPSHAYELTRKSEELFPQNYHMLTVDLLSELDDNPETAPYINMMFQGRKRKLLDRYEDRMAQKDLAEKVDELVAIQNAGGYMAEAKRDQHYYYIAEYNCPIKGVADRYHQACQCELELFQDLLGTKVERTECLAKGGTKCNYRIQMSSNAEVEA